MINILVVEDDANLNRIICTSLNDNGYYAKGCLCANSAYDAMYDTQFSLIITDIMMPVIDGFEIAETVRNVDKVTPILFMTARDDVASMQKGFRLGIDDYMVKPVNLDLLSFMDTQKKIEKTVVSAYKKIEDTFVSGYKKIEDKFVETFLTESADSSDEK